MPKTTIRPYYTFPLNTDQLQGKQLHARCDRKEGITQYVHLILKTHLTEYRYDYEFGCFVWNQDFENIQSISKWEHQLETQIKATIQRYEKRLEDILVKIKIEEPVDFIQETKFAIRLKRRIVIAISGRIRKTYELFHHNEFIYFSPLSI